LRTAWGYEVQVEDWQAGDLLAQTDRGHQDDTGKQHACWVLQETEQFDDQQDREGAGKQGPHDNKYWFALLMWQFINITM
jgi:hypothetical protein